MNAKERARKDAEHNHLTALASIRPDLGIAELPIEWEEPDFICQIDGGWVGIEITVFHRPPTPQRNPQALENYKNQLQEFLISEHVRQGLPPLHVSVHLAQETHITEPKSREALGSALVEFVKSKNVSRDGLLSFEYEDLPPPLQDYGVHSVSVYFNVTYKEVSWSLPGAYWLQDASINILQEVITKKSAKVENYKEKARKAGRELKASWLVIVLTASESSDVNLGCEVFEHKYKSDFDRIFLLRPGGRMLPELERL